MMRGMERKKAKRRPRRVAEKARPAPAVAVAPPPAPGGAGLLVALETPEPVFATRVPPPVPERRRPTTRHAIFFDVENTSHPAHIERVIERLAIDHLGRSTEFVAVGNWRVIGHETARLLARRGAQLVHSAPSTGVRDWSDLRIAVDRKSTRLNSSHLVISYAVFCLKKKKINTSYHYTYAKYHLTDV